MIYNILTMPPPSYAANYPSYCARASRHSLGGRASQQSKMPPPKALPTCKKRVFLSKKASTAPLKNPAPTIKNPKPVESTTHPYPTASDGKPLLVCSPVYVVLDLQSTSLL